MNTKIFHKMKYNLKGHVRPLLLLWRGCMFSNFQIFWSNYILDLRYYGQLLSMFTIYAYAKIKAWGEVLIEHQQRGWNHQIIQNSYLSAHYRNHVYKNPGNVWLDYGLPTLKLENKSVFQYNCISHIKKVQRKKDALAGFNSYLN